MCKACEECNLEFFDCGKKASCASFLMFRCDSCHYSRSFWSVSGTFGRSSFPVGASKIKKRNDMVYNCILDGRLVGIGFNKLSLYHSALNILPHQVVKFLRVLSEIFLSEQSTLLYRVWIAEVDLESIYMVPSSNKHVHYIASYDGAYQ